MAYLAAGAVAPADLDADLSTFLAACFLACDFFTFFGAGASAVVAAAGAVLFVTFGAATAGAVVLATFGAAGAWANDMTAAVESSAAAITVLILDMVNLTHKTTVSKLGPSRASLMLGQACIYNVGFPRGLTEIRFFTKPSRIDARSSPAA